MKINKRTLFFAIEVVLSLLASVCFFFGFQILAADFADFSHLYRVLPAILSYFSPLYVLFVLHLFFRNEKAKVKAMTSFGNGLALLIIGTALLAINIIYFANGFYPLDGMLTAMFPIDIILLSSLSALLGSYLVFVSKRIPVTLELSAPQKKSKKEIALKILHSIFFPFFSLIALYELGGLLLGFGFASYDSPLFGYGIPAYVAMFLPSLYLLLREVFWLRPLPSKKARLLFSSLSLGFGVVLGILPLLFLLAAPTYVESLFHPYYPLDFMGSLRISLYLWSIPNVLSPFFFFFYPSMKELSSK